jgi:hypothetical protein
MIARLGYEPTKALAAVQGGDWKINFQPPFDLFGEVEKAHMPPCASVACKLLVKRSFFPLLLGVARHQKYQTDELTCGSTCRSLLHIFDLPTRSKGAHSEPPVCEI